jgi:hypothetical protein
MSCVECMWEDKLKLELRRRNRWVGVQTLVCRSYRQRGPTKKPALPLGNAGLVIWREGDRMSPLCAYSAGAPSASAFSAAWSRSHARRLIFTRPRSSTPRHLAEMTSPFLTTSSTFSVRPSASSETWMSPSLPGSTSMKAPKAVTETTRGGKLAVSKGAGGHAYESIFRHAHNGTYSGVCFNGLLWRSLMHALLLSEYRSRGDSITCAKLD